MPVSIRLARHGAKKRPFYRIIVADARSPRDGRRVEQVGIYDPRQTPSRIELDTERLERWLKAGAKPSATVSQLIRKSAVQHAAAEGATESPAAAAPAPVAAEPAASEPAASEPAASDTEASGESA